MTVQLEQLAKRTGSGGDPPMLNAAQSRSQLLEASKEGRLPAAPAARMREDRWDDRHTLMFRNEEWSRLDRCYFDRWREPDCLFVSLDSVRENIGSVRVWSLEPTEGPAETAAKVTAKSEHRFRDDWSSWDKRHHLMFPTDRTHPNLRSYFERPRERPTESASPETLEMADPSLSDEPSYTDPTAAFERRQRQKPTDDENKLEVSWSLQDFAGPDAHDHLHRSLRQPFPERDPKLKKKKERRREAWFSSHGVLF